MRNRQVLCTSLVDIASLARTAVSTAVEWLESPLAFDVEWMYNQLRAVEEQAYRAIRILGRIPLDSLDKDVIQSEERGGNEAGPRAGDDNNDLSRKEP